MISHLRIHPLIETFRIPPPAFEGPKRAHRWSSSDPTHRSRSRATGPGLIAGHGAQSPGSGALLEAVVAAQDFRKSLADAAQVVSQQRRSVFHVLRAVNIAECICIIGNQITPLSKYTWCNSSLRRAPTTLPKSHILATSTYYGSSTAERLKHCASLRHPLGSNL